MSRRLETPWIRGEGSLCGTGGGGGGGDVCNSGLQTFMTNTVMDRGM